MRYLVSVGVRTLCALVFAGSGSSLSAAPTTLSPAGWKRVEIPASGSHFWRYIPFSLDQTQPAPLVLFFHGAGSFALNFRTFVQEAAEEARCVVALPQSSSFGWGTTADEISAGETLRLVGAEVVVDARRTAVAGYSAGGAYAYLLAYLEPSGFSAVFTLAAPSHPVPAVADPAYKAPIRMYYGTTDPNFTGGGAALLSAQWTRLGVPWEVDVQAGYGHNSWPDSSMTAGFLFLVAHAYPAAEEPGCVPSDTALCLHDGRFRVEVTWTDHQQGEGNGHVVPCSARDSGLFWFFAPDNWEMLVKMVDGCGLNGRWWVFVAATTDVGYEVTVTEVETGATARYENPPGRRSPAITDTGALDVCP